MSLHKGFVTVLFLLLFIGLAVNVQQATAQTSGSTSSSSRESVEDETTLDTRLYLLPATNQEITEVKPPVQLDQVIKQLRAALPFKNYGLSATLINRVNDGNGFSVKWIGSLSTTPRQQPRSIPASMSFTSAG